MKKISVSLKQENEKIMNMQKKSFKQLTCMDNYDKCINKIYNVARYNYGKYEVSKYLQLQLLPFIIKKEKSVF